MLIKNRHFSRTFSLIYGLIAVLFTLASQPLQGMKKEQAATKVVPLVLESDLIAPPEIVTRQKNKQSLSQEELEILTAEAQKGHAPQLQYLLGCYYCLGLTPDKKPDFKESESWLLRARRKDYLPAFVQIIDCAEQQGDYKKWQQYAQEAIKRGFIDQYFNLGKALCMQNKYHQAAEALKNAIEGLKDHQDNIQLKWTRELAQVELAFLLKRGYLGPADLKQSLAVLNEVAKQKNIHALFALAFIHLENNKELPKDVKSAYNILSRIEKNYEEFILFPLDTHTYCKVLNTLGRIYEKEYNNIEKALQYYRKCNVGELDIARLIITQKIDGDPQEAKKILRAAYEAGSTVGRYMYGTILLMDGSQKEAMQVWEKNHSTCGPSWNPLTALQLGIGYLHGFGVEQDKTKAQQYFYQILNDPDLAYRSVLLARGYMYLFGLGGIKKDINKGLSLIKESEAKIDDVYFATEELFPIIGKIRTKERESVTQRLIEEEQKKKEKKQKKKIFIAPEEGDPFDVTIEQWNATFEVKDGSYVSCIDKKAKKFVIDDPQREQQLIITLENMPDRDLSEIDALKYHKRIFERQGNGKQKLHQSTKYNHDFAEMLDYAIQYLGEHVPFIKVGSEHPDDQITAIVLRKDLKTGKVMHCKAEYTFGQKDNDTYVYHRLLRPIKNPIAP